LTGRPPAALRRLAGARRRRAQGRGNGRGRRAPRRLTAGGFAGPAHVVGGLVDLGLVGAEVALGEGGLGGGEGVVGLLQQLLHGGVRRWRRRRCARGGRGGRGRRQLLEGRGGVAEEVGERLLEGVLDRHLVAEHGDSLLELGQGCPCRLHVHGPDVQQRLIDRDDDQVAEQHL